MMTDFVFNDGNHLKLDVNFVEMIGDKLSLMDNDIDALCYNAALLDIDTIKSATINDGYLDSFEEEAKKMLKDILKDKLSSHIL